MAGIRRIVLIEDDESLRGVIAKILELRGFDVLAFGDGREALARLVPPKSPAKGLPLADNPPPSLILCDFRLPEISGLDVLSELRAQGIDTPFIIMTAYANVEIAVSALKRGAQDFICKPFEPDYLCTVLEETITHRRIVNRRALPPTRSYELFTTSPRMRGLLDEAAAVAEVDSSVLILGESGTGKELLARFIHERSPRRTGPFVAINCGAVPGELLESELFGHEAGAFTGATQQRVGLFEVAHEGTLFLDEIGDMPPLLQVKLLRVLQEREIKRVGGNKQIPAAPRVLAATNRSIERSIQEGRLREDLYYRVSVIRFELPPLRSRRDDILPLAERFIARFSERQGRTPPTLADEAQAELLTYRWPGNIRELENVMERAVVLSRREITPEDLDLPDILGETTDDEDTPLTLPEAAERALIRTERDLIKKTLARTNGNRTKAAELLGVSYKTLLNKVKEYGV